MTKVECQKLCGITKSSGPVTTTANVSGATSSAPIATTASNTSNTETKNVTVTTNSGDSSSASLISSSTTETPPTTSTTEVSQKSNVSNNAQTSTIKHDSQTLTTVELQVLSELDSTQFGFVRLNEETNARKKGLVLKAIKYLERFIVRSRERQRRAAAEPNNNGKNRPNEINPSLYCKLGHLHLLLENFSKALSAYQTFFKLKKGSSQKLLNMFPAEN